MSTTRDTATPDRPVPAPRRDPALRGAAATSAFVALVGLRSLADPRWQPYDDAQQALATVVLGPTAVSVVLVAAAVAGAVAAGVALVARSRATAAVATGVGVLEVLVLGVGMQSTTTIALLGYVLAVALPAVLLGAVVLLLRHRRGTRWPIALVALGAAAWGAAAGPPVGRVTGSLARDVARGFVDAAPVLVAGIAVTAAATAWSWVVVGRLLGAAVGRRLEDRVVRHRWPITVLAAIGPCPTCWCGRRG